MFAATPPVLSLYAAQGQRQGASSFFDKHLVSVLIHVPDIHCPSAIANSSAASKDGSHDPSSNASQKVKDSRSYSKAAYTCPSLLTSSVQIAMSWFLSCLWRCHAYIISSWLRGLLPLAKHTGRNLRHKGWRSDGTWGFVHSTPCTGHSRHLRSVGLLPQSGRECFRHFGAE